MYRSPYVSIEDTFGCFSAVGLTFRHCLVGKTGKATNVSANISTCPWTPAAGGGAWGVEGNSSELGIPSMLPLTRAWGFLLTLLAASDLAFKPCRISIGFLTRKWWGHRVISVWAEVVSKWSSVKTGCAGGRWLLSIVSIAWEKGLLICLC